MRSKLAKIFALIVTLILIIQIPLLMKSEIRAEFKDQTFFEAEKALRKTLPIKLSDIRKI